MANQLHATVSPLHPLLPKIPRADDKGLSAAELEKIEASWQRHHDRYEKGIRRSQTPLSMEELRAVKDLGRTVSDTHRRAVLEAHIALVQASIRNRLNRDDAPQKLLFIIDGPDMAGKSSLERRIRQCLPQMRKKEKKNYVVHETSFKAPKKNERQNHYLDRFKADLQVSFQSQKAAAVFWDRSPLGDLVYQHHSHYCQNTMAWELNCFFKELEEQGVFVCKILLYCSQAKQRRILGKRLADAEHAHEIASRRQLAGEQLEEVRKMVRVGSADFRAYVDSPAITATFQDFAAATGDGQPWILQDTTKRLDSKLRVLEALNERLRAWAEGRTEMGPKVETGL